RQLQERMIGDRVSIGRAGAVADIRLRRPFKMNALDGPMFDALIAAAESVAVDPTIRAVVLSGEGKAFCAGIDLESLQALMSDEGKQAMQSRSHGLANRYQQAALAWREVPVPVIAALHGVAFGGGLQIPLGADIRISAPDTKFSLMEVRWGIVPDMAGTVLLRSIVREDVLRELIYTARVFTGIEAASMGIVTQLAANPHVAALELASSIAEQGPRAVRAAKQLLNETQSVSPQVALLSESEAQVGLLAGPDQIEALNAHAEQRKPYYTDPEVS
ncbi:crotonase/enoyl-CoA hydratase family protein, partial [Sphingomonas koreensis]